MGDSDSSSDASPFGWALRVNGSCLDIEEDCGQTVDPYRVCCPGGSFCPHAYNPYCCPSEANCTESLQASPHCANETWDLYINGGYFCCEHGTVGYATDTDSNGCGDPDYELGFGESALPIIKTGTVSTSTPSPTSTAVEMTATDSPVTTPTSSDSGSSSSASANSGSSSSSNSGSSSSSSSDTNTGAIAGGVVGGVCGAAIILLLIWLLLRTRRRQQQQQQQGAAANEAVMPTTENFNKVAPPVQPESPLPPAPPPVEMEAHRFAELGGDHQVVSELPGREK